MALTDTPKELLNLLNSHHFFASNPSLHFDTNRELSTRDVVVLHQNVKRLITMKGVHFNLLGSRLISFIQLHTAPKESVRVFVVSAAVVATELVKSQAKDKVALFKTEITLKSIMKHAQFAESETIKSFPNIPPSLRYLTSSLWLLESALCSANLQLVVSRYPSIVAHRYSPFLCNSYCEAVVNIATSIVNQEFSNSEEAATELVLKCLPVLQLHNRHNPREVLSMMIQINVSKLIHIPCKGRISEALQKAAGGVTPKLSMLGLSLLGACGANDATCYGVIQAIKDGHQSSVVQSLSPDFTGMEWSLGLIKAIVCSALINVTVVTSTMARETAILVLESFVEGHLQLEALIKKAVGTISLISGTLVMSKIFLAAPISMTSSKQQPRWWPEIFRNDTVVMERSLHLVEQWVSAVFDILVENRSSGLHAALWDQGILFVCIILQQMNRCSSAQWIRILNVLSKVQPLMLHLFSSDLKIQKQRQKGMLKVHQDLVLRCTAQASTEAVQFWVEAKLRRALLAGKSLLLQYEASTPLLVLSSSKKFVARQPPAAVIQIFLELVVSFTRNFPSNLILMTLAQRALEAPIIAKNNVAALIVPCYLNLYCPRPAAQTTKHALPPLQLAKSFAVSVRTVCQALEEGTDEKLEVILKDHPDATTMILQAVGEQSMDVVVNCTNTGAALLVAQSLFENVAWLKTYASTSGKGHLSAYLSGLCNLTQCSDPRLLNRVCASLESILLDYYRGQPHEQQFWLKFLEEVVQRTNNIIVKNPIASWIISLREKISAVPLQSKL